MMSVELESILHTHTPVTSHIRYCSDLMRHYTHSSGFVLFFPPVSESCYPTFIPLPFDVSSNRLASLLSQTQTFPFPPLSPPFLPPQQPVPRPRCWVAGRFLYTARLYGMKHRPSWRCRARRQYAANARTSRGVTRRKPTTSRATQPPSVSRSEQ